MTFSADAVLGSYYIFIDKRLVSHLPRAKFTNSFRPNIAISDRGFQFGS